MKSHLVMSIAGLERTLKGKKPKTAHNYCLMAFDMTLMQVNNEIEKYKELGYKFIPAEGCDNIKEDGRCGGHKD